MGSRAGLDGRIISPPPGIDPRTVQPVAQSLYRLSYRAHTPITTNSKLAVKVKFVGRICKENLWILFMANTSKARADQTVRFLLSYLLLAPSHKELLLFRPTTR